MLKKIIVGGSIAFGIVGFLIILFQFSFDEVFSFFNMASIYDIILFLIVSFFITMVLAWKIKVVMDSQGLKVPFWDIYRYRLSGYSISYVTPGPRVGGEPVMAQLMKKYYNIDFMKSLSCLVIDKTVEVSILGILFIFGGALLLLNFALPPDTKFIVILVGVLFALGISYFYYQMLKGRHFFVRIAEVLRLNRLKLFKKYERRFVLFERRIINFYRNKRRAFYQVVGITILSWVLMYFEYKFALSILGVQVSIFGLFLIFSFIGATLLLPIPMALGAQEAGQISVFAIIGQKTGQGVALSLLIRARDLLIVGIGFLLLSYYGLDIKKMVRKLFRKLLKPEKAMTIVPGREE